MNGIHDEGERQGCRIARAGTEGDGRGLNAAPERSRCPDIANLQNCSAYVTLHVLGIIQCWLLQLISSFPR